MPTVPVNTDEVAEHYNKHRPRCATTPEMVQIRSFHNFVKARLIANACTEVSLSGNASRFLDMCCGNGGDLGKLVPNGIHEYYGIDIANEAVRRASERLKEIKHLVGNTFAFNAFSSTCGEMLFNMPRFDIVSCQFALHYAFSTERTARTFIQNVATALRPGGQFIGTIPDAEYLLQRKRLLGRRFGDAKHAICFEHDGEPADFGTRYTFSLTGAVEALDEYVVTKDVLVRICNDCGLELCEWYNFEDYRRFKGCELWNRMGAAYHEISSMYCSFVFVLDEVLHGASDAMADM